jgi:hypothetical protein
VIDLCHLDEVGFAMTLPTTYSWFPIGARLLVPYHASEGRRVNAIGAYFTHGLNAGHFAYQTWASLPKSRAKKQRKTAQEIAAVHGLTADDVGPIDAQRVLAFIWHIAGCPSEASSGWKRVRPLMIVLDNYSVHKSQVVTDARPHLEAANIHLVYLPAYCPQLSGIEPVWNDIKQHQLPTRSFARVSDLKRAVEAALAHKAHQLQHAAAKSTNIQRLAA